MDTFWPKEAEIILGIHVSKRGGEDKLILDLHTKGIFTIMSAYYAAIQNMRKDSSSTSTDSEERELWKSI